jgi:hypothetical protein
MLLLPLTIGLVCPVHATEIYGRASTVMEWYDDPDEDTAIPLHQYLQLSLIDISDTGYNFKVYGRLAEDIENEVEIDSRLYYAYLEKRDFLTENLDMRLGRQFISTTAGASLMDGLNLDYTFNDDYHVKLYGGGDVTDYEGYNVDSNGVWGAEVGGFFLDKALDANLSYQQKWEDGVLSMELIGFDASYDWDGKLWVYNETQWDWLSDRLSYELIGAKYRFEEPFTLRLEYLYSMPVFSSTSIYSVFAVEDYEEVYAEVTWTMQPGLQSFARYWREIYDEFDDANVFEIGVEKFRTGKFSGYISGIIREDDDGQDMKGFKTRAAYRFMPEFEGGIGAELNVLDREIAYFDTDDTDQGETTNTRLWIYGVYDFTKKLSLEAKFERVESDLWDYYNRGRIRLNLLF